MKTDISTRLKYYAAHTWRTSSNDFVAVKINSWAEDADQR